jgi:hypothetical protein
MAHLGWVLLAALSTHSRRRMGKTKTQIRSQVKLERHRGVSQEFIYIYGSESESECEAKYSSGS